LKGIIIGYEEENTRMEEKIGMKEKEIKELY